MKRTLVFALVACCAVSALAPDKGKSKPSASVAPAFEFSSPATNTSTTPKTTTHSHNTTNTTTPAPTTHSHNTTNTTTPAPTTHSHNTTNTTTPAPTPKPTTTKTTVHTTVPPHPPQPTPEPEVGNYNLTSDKKEVCVLARMGLQIRLVTAQGNGTFNVNPNMTTVKGSCDEPKANFTLSFKEGFITFMFNKSAANNSVYVNALSFNLTFPLIKAATTYSANNKSVHLFAARIGRSYSCKNDTLYMGNGLYLEVSKDQMQAFNLTKAAEFGPPDLCPADKPDYRVAIAVGITLLILIVIVVVAYMLSRRKRTDGYQSL